MFYASNFTYGGVSSSTYGLQIADFDNKDIIETTVFSPSLNTLKTSVLNRFFYNSVDYTTPPTYKFTILSESIIGDTDRRSILKWLVGRNAFLPLVIQQPDLVSYTYYVVFTDVDLVYHNGYCVGFNITANFDSPYARGTDVVTNTITGTGTTPVSVSINNKSDIDGYVYPKLHFTPSSAVSGKAISIYNTTDSQSRETSFKWYDSTNYPHGIVAGETVDVDNELHIISSSVDTEKLSCFNKNWLRLRPGINTLNIYLNGTCTITCPTYVMIGF